MKRTIITCDRCGAEIVTGHPAEPWYQMTTVRVSPSCGQDTFENFDLCGACHSSLHQEWTEMRQP